jgi:4-aminobutyrate aminotransferase-like enzyme
LEFQGFSHLSSHQNDPLAAAAIHAVIDIVEEEKLIEHSHKAGVYFVDQLKSLQCKHPIISDVRGRGLMIGIELSNEIEFAKNRQIAFELAMWCERRGLHITFSYYEPVIRIIPPLIVSYKEIDAAVAIIHDALTALENGSTDLGGLGPQNARTHVYMKQTNGRLSPIKLLRGLWKTSPQQWVNKLKKAL